MSRIFEKFPAEAICPLCHKNTEGKCFLMPIAGTQKDHICEAQPTHLDCLAARYADFMWQRDADIIFLRTGEKP